MRRWKSRRFATIVLAGFALLPRAAIGSKIQKGTLIPLADGDVQGATNDRTRQFLGIPYAAPPVGALRFRPPAPVTPRSGVLQATAFAPGCPQLASIQGP